MATGLTEYTDEQAFVNSTTKFIRPESRQFNVPDTMFGDYVSVVGVVTAVELNETQQAALETAIEAITGVSFAKVVIGPTRLSGDRMPTDTVDTDYQLRAKVGLGLDAVAVPIEP